MSPFSRHLLVSCSVSSPAGSFVSGSLTSSIPRSSPRPRTSPMIGWSSFILMYASFRYWPFVRATSASPSFTSTSITARPTAAANGSFWWDEMKAIPLSWQVSSISSDVIIADRGSPAPRVLDSARMSGTKPSCSKANVAPTLPIPVCASSRMNSIPRSSHICLTSGK